MSLISLAARAGLSSACVKPLPASVPIQAQEDRSLPLRWACPTAIRLQRWSAKSDVWSFGVLVWETFALGAVPYAERTAHEALQFASQGGRLQRPSVCPLRVWRVSCCGAVSDVIVSCPWLPADGWRDPVSSATHHPSPSLAPFCVLFGCSSPSLAWKQSHGFALHSRRLNRH